MLLEAIRVQLIESGTPEAAHWTPKQVVDHVDKVFLTSSTEDPEEFPRVVVDFFAHVKTTMLTVHEVLKDEPL